MNMQTNKSLKVLENKLSKAIKQGIIIGSLVYLRRKCGTEKKYGAYFLSRSKKGKTYLTYIPKEKAKKIREKVAKYKEVKQILKKISEINIKILGGN